MTAIAIALILAAIWLLGWQIVAIVLAGLFVGIGSICGIGAMWFVIGEGR